MKNEKSPAFLAVLLGLVAFATASYANERAMREFDLDYSTATDPDLQEHLDTIDARLREKYGMAAEEASVGILDLTSARLAMINPDHMEYAASVPKIGILLAYFELNPDASRNMDPDTRDALGSMIKSSSNEMATRFSRELGLREIQNVLNRYQFYDEERGGGLWVGKHYGQGDERYGDPLKDHSHAATVRQLLRFYLMLEQRKLVSTEASNAMLEIFASPEIPHDNIKFVKGLAGRDVELLRKWGTWRDWRHDSAIVKSPNRQYILVALTRNSQGDSYLEELAAAVDDFFANEE